MTRTGDGLIAALQILSVICRTGKPASELLSCFTPIPQRLVNLKDIDRAVLSDKRVAAQVAQSRQSSAVMGASGLRPSGTEPLIRVMVEAVDKARLDAAMDKLVTVLKAASQE